MNPSKSNKILSHFGTIIYVSLAIAFAHSVFNSNSRLATFVKETFGPKVRIVLSTVSGALLENGEMAKIVKVKTNKGIFVEIYQTGDGQFKLLDSVHLADSKDAFFNFYGRPANLALDDIDGDNKLEIIVPSYNKNLVSNLNIFQFDTYTKALVAKPN